MKPFFNKLEYQFSVESTITLKTHHFHTKQSYQNPMLRQVEWWVQKRSITMNQLLPLAALFFENFVWVWESLTKSWFNLQTTQICESAGVLFERGFSLWVSLKLIVLEKRRVFLGLFANMKETMVCYCEENVHWKWDSKMFEL